MENNLIKNNSETNQIGLEEISDQLTDKETLKSTSSTETVDQLKNQLQTLMNSLATLSAEKSKMEANFQSDKKQLRNERDECDKVVKDLRDKLKKAQNHNHSEIEHIKCKLIMERHDRERERNENSAIIKELENLLIDERKKKEQAESQLKSQFANKTQCKILEAELDIMKNKLKQAEEASKETPPILLSLQTEMSTMKKQHRNAILEEQKRAAVAEQRARTLAVSHETRVAGLEARLAELSEIVGGYDKLRQQDQNAIQTLKEQLANLKESDQKNFSTLNNEPEELVKKIKEFYSNLLSINNKSNNSVYVKSLLNSLGLCDVDKYIEYKKKYELTIQELEDCKHHVWSDNSSTSTNISQMIPINKFTESHNNSIKTQIHFLKTHNSNLEERIRLLNADLAKKEKEFKINLEHERKVLQDEHKRLEHVYMQKENEYRGKICALEQQLLNQRERSKALVAEKNKEIITLKASFHALLPKRESSSNTEQKENTNKYENLLEASNDLMPGLLSSESPPILYYTQELARREIQVSTTRKRALELEATLREKQREYIHAESQHKEEIKSLQEKITRLEACQSREGANLEYLKNVIVNYLTTNDNASKRHMLNAIITVLRFTSGELDKIKHLK